MASWVGRVCSRRLRRVRACSGLRRSRGTSAASAGPPVPAHARPADGLIRTRPETRGGGALSAVFWAGRVSGAQRASAAIQASVFKLIFIPFATQLGAAELRSSAVAVRGLLRAPRLSRSLMLSNFDAPKAKRPRAAWSSEALIFGKSRVRGATIRENYGFAHQKMRVSRLPGLA